jgi:hypothetical protein
MAQNSKDSVSDDVVREALEHFEDSIEGSEYNRELYYEDVRFARLSDQWPDAIKKQRTQEARPVLVINKLPALIRSVVNESRQNKPAIKVSPVDSGADEETAEVIGGLIRSVERGSNAEVAYDTAIDSAVTGGFGFFRIGIDYAHDESFDLECGIQRIPNALMVHWDTSSTKFDASDWEYAFISDFIGEDEYEKKYPGASMVPFDGDSRNDASDQWINEDEIRVAEYFLRVMKTRKLLQLAIMNPETQQMDLRAVRDDDMPEMAKRFFQAGEIDLSKKDEKDIVAAFLEASGTEVRREREVEFHEVKRRIINGVEVLEEDDWPGSTIPICPVWGDEIYLDGRRNFKSMIRDAKDSQMMFNFWRSATTELVALAPKAPWVGPKGFVPKNQEQKWSSANTRSHAYLEYDKSAGEAPSRVPFAGVPAGALQEAMNANDDMKAITGIFDSSIGAQSNETSGKAILARERQGDVSNFHFTDNLSRAIRYAGQVLVEIIPSVYSARETIRILGEDEALNVKNLTQQGGGAYQEGVDGQPELYNLTVGKYDVTVDTGPSFATEREQTRETLIEIMRQVPDAAPFIGDVLLDHMDFVGADKVAKRLKHLLPPEVREMEEDEGNQKNPEAAAMQQKFQAYQQQVQQAQQQVMAEIEKITKENEALKQNNQADMQKAQVEGQKAQDAAAAKNRELDQKDRELELMEDEATIKASLDAEKPTAKEQWSYDMDEAAEKRAFDASEADKDRQVDLAKTILSQSDAEDGADDGTAMAMAMEQALAMMTAPKRVVRDPVTGQVMGVETITDG